MVVYTGKLCSRHPAAGGKRQPKTGRCVECHKETCRIGARRRHEQLKSEVMESYGGKCIRCGESDIDVLTVDHTNQDGAKHRAELGGRSVGPNKVYRSIKAAGFPPGFRVLCFNCNIKVFVEFRRTGREVS